MDKLIVGGLALGGVSALAGLSPWPVGLWGDSEPVALALHAGGALIALGLAGAGRRDPAWLLACFRHPFVLLPLLLAGWSLVAPALSAPDPAQALLGSPQTAEGPWLFLDVALFVAAGRVLRGHPVYTRYVGWGALALGLGIPGLSLFPETRLYFFGAWMVYLAIAAPIVVATFLEDDVPPRRRLLLAALAGFPGWLLSGSITAIAAGLLVVPAVILACRPPDPTPSRRTPLLLAGATLAIVCFLGLGTLAIAESYGAVRPTLRALESVWSRGHLQDVLLTDLADHPLLWLIGTGWGQTYDIFLRSLPAAGLSMWNGSWDMTGRDIVNSHHVALEALLAAGLPGMLLRLAALAALPLFCRPGWGRAAGFFALALGTLEALWFQLPGTTPIVALALAGLAPPLARSGAAASLASQGAAAAQGTAAALPCPPTPIQSWAKTLGAGGLAPVLLVCALVQALATAELTRQSLAASSLESAYLTPVLPPPQADCDSARFSGWRAQRYLAYLLEQEIGLFQDAPATAATRAALANLVCLAERPPFRRSIALPTFVMMFRNDLLLPDHQAERAFFPDLAASGQEPLFAYLAHAPRRTDLAIPFLAALVHQHQFAELSAVTSRLLALRPNDPVALWFSGMAQLSQPETRDQAVRDLRRGLAQGIDQRMPIDPTERAQILAY